MTASIKKKKVPSPCVKNGWATYVRNISRSRLIQAYENIGVDVAEWIKTDVRMYRCDVTGYRFFYPREIVGNREFYSMLSESREYYSDWRWEHQKAFEHLSRIGVHKICEYGCGPGNFLKKINATTKYGIDFNEEAIMSATADGSVTRISGENFDTEIGSQEVDIFCMFQVLEHIPEVHDFLRRVNKVMKTGGLLILGVPNNNPFLFRWDLYHALNLPPHHVGLWDKSSLFRVMKEHGFSNKITTTEPLLDVDYWVKVNAAHYFGKNLGKKILFRLYKRYKNGLSAYFKNREGRNIFCVFEKICDCSSNQ